MTSQRMSRVDTAWLRMDNEVNLMVIVGVWLLRPAINYAALCARVSERLLSHERFRQLVVRDAEGAMWVDDADFNLSHHVRTERLRPSPGQSAEQALQAWCGELAGTPLDAAKPLWCMHLVEDYEGGSALIVRIHHCLGDGLALVAVMMSITDDGAALPQRRARPNKDGAAFTRGMDALAQAEPGIGLALARAGTQLLSDLAALALLPNDSPTRLKGHGTGAKRVAWNQPLPLADVKAVCRVLDCSVNDVLLACVAGAIGQYLRGKGDDPTGQEIRAMVPVNLRPPDQAPELGNRFGLVPLQMPVGVANPLERIQLVRQRMRELKGSFQPVVAYGVLALAGLMSADAQSALLDVFSSKATAVMTNVPGPREPLRFLGSTIYQTVAWVPASGDIGLGVSILSYAGGVQFGLITDAALCPDPQVVIDGFAPEFEKFVWLALMLPWRSEH